MAKRPAFVVPDHWPIKDSFIYWPLDHIIPYDKNPRTHPPEQIALLAQLFTKYGPDQHIVVDERREILKGHGRRLSSIAAGLTHYPVVQRHSLSEAEKLAMRIADNQIALLAGWDANLIRGEVVSLKTAGYDIALLGFPEVQLRAWSISVGPTAAQDPEAVPERPAAPIVRAGDLWVLGEHRLLCGDSTKPKDVARVLAGEQPDLMATDPPYGDSYEPGWRRSSRVAAGLRHEGVGAAGQVKNDHVSDWRAAWMLYAGAVAYVWHGDRQAIEAGPVFRECGLELRNLIVWSKVNFVISRGHYHPQHEVCLYLVRAGATAHWQGGRKQSTRWDITHVRSETGHGTQKPIECMRRPIENHTKKGDLVYEPFCGSGTTIIAAELTGRRALALEIDPSYVQVALERWQGVTGQVATLDGVPFPDVAAGRRNGTPRHRRRSTRK